MWRRAWTARGKDVLTYVKHKRGSLPIYTAPSVVQHHLRALLRVEAKLAEDVFLHGVHPANCGSEAGNEILPTLYTVGGLALEFLLQVAPNVLNGV